MGLHTGLRQAYDCCCIAPPCRSWLSSTRWMLTRLRVCSSAAPVSCWWWATRCVGDTGLSDLSRCCRCCRVAAALHLSRSATSPAGCQIHIQVTAARCPAPCRPAGRQPPPRPAHLRCGAGGAAGERGPHLAAGGEWRRSSSRSSGGVVKATASCGCCALHRSVMPAPITLLGA